MAPSKNETTALLEQSRPDGGNGDASAARKAFESADVDASRQYHESRRVFSVAGTEGGRGANVQPGQVDEAWHQSEGGLLKPIIFGGLDGILTSFAIVAGSAGGGLSPTVVLVLGFSNIFADALR